MDQVEEVKSKTDVVVLVGEYVKLNKAGRNFKGLCPFHGEKTPSFMVNPELQIYKCFGCGEGGDVISFLQKMEGLEFGEALKILAKKAGVTLKSYTPTQGEELREKLYKINGMAKDYYHFLLTEHNMGKAAREYLAGRKITQKAIKTFQLGFAPEGWDFLIKYLVGKKNFKEFELEKAGLTIPSQKGGYDRFRGRIMFPLNNHRSQTVGFAGRVMPGADEKAGGKYVNTSETDIYHKGDLLYGLDVNKTHIKTANHAVVVEGEIDAIASWQAGVENVVAIKGSALTPKQVEILKRYTDTVTLALDVDMAGDMASRRGIEIAEKAGIIVKVTNPVHQIPDYPYKDPGECATENPEMWKRIVENAVPVYDFYIDSAVDRFGLDVEGKIKIGRELIPIWAKIDDEITRGHYIKKLADTLGVAENDVRGQINKILKPEAENKKPEVVKDDRKSHREIVEEYVIGFALRTNRISLIIQEPIKSWIKTGFWKKVLTFIENLGPEGNDIKKLIAELPGELKDRVENLMLIEDGYKSDEEAKEWNKAISELEEMSLREKIEELNQSGNSLPAIVEVTTRLNELTRGK